MSWPTYTRQEFERNEMWTEYEPTTGVKYIDRKKYELYWSNRFGGIWVRTTKDRLK